MDKDAINELTNLFDKYPSQNLDNPDEGLVAIRDKLFTLLCSPMKDDYAHEAFKWVAHLTLIKGDFSWICSDGRWKGQDEIKIFLCVARLALTEIEVLMPLLNQSLISHAPEIEDGKIVARSANLDEYDKFGNYLVIIENLIKSLVKDDKFNACDSEESCTNYLTLNMTHDDLGSLLDHLKKTLTMLLRFLENAHLNWNKIDKRCETEQFAAIMSSTRIVAIWLADDPCGFAEQTEKFIIDLFIKILLDDQNDNQNIDIYVVALHSLCTEDAMIESLKKRHRLKDALQKYLNFVSSEYDHEAKSTRHLRQQTKIHKLRCGMVRDILEICVKKK